MNVTIGETYRLKLNLRGVQNDYDKQMQYAKLAGGTFDASTAVWNFEPSTVNEQIYLNRLFTHGVERL